MQAIWTVANQVQTSMLMLRRTCLQHSNKISGAVRKAKQCALIWKSIIKSPGQRKNSTDIHFSPISLRGTIILLQSQMRNLCYFLLIPLLLPFSTIFNKLPSLMCLVFM